MLETLLARLCTVPEHARSLYAYTGLLLLNFFYTFSEQQQQQEVQRCLS